MDTSVIPTKEESKELRLHYFKLGIVMAVILLVFNGLNTLMMRICSGVMAGGFSADDINSGKELFRGEPWLCFFRSFGFPIIAEFAAICLGIALTGIDLPKKFNVKNVTSGGMLKFTAVAFAVMTIGAFLNEILIAIIILFSGGGSLADTLSKAAVPSLSSYPHEMQYLIYFYVCLLGPVLEELIYRGILLDGLRKYGNAFGIIASSMLFGLMHQNIIQCLPAMMLGVVFAYMDIKCGSIWPSVIVHILNNSLSSLLMLLINDIDLSGMLNSEDIFAVEMELIGNVPLMAALMFNMLLRLICIVASVIIAARFFGSRKKTVDRSEYCRRRTWKYFFTSFPWLICIIYMVVTTFTSLGL